jgi:multicomponent Na+:H+ antiporter subunit E
VTRHDLGFAAALTVAWVLFWGDLSVANVVTGFAASAVLLVVFPLERHVEQVRHRVRPIPALRLGLTFAWELARSNLQVARDVLGGRRREHAAVVACPLRVGTPGVLTFLTNLFALSPGTMPIDISEEPPVIYLHVLRLEDPEAVRARMARFETLFVRALGDDEAVAAVALPPPPPPHLDREVRS